MKFSEVIDFKKDIYFEGAVQADWFYNKDKANIVAENYVFHTDEYIDKSSNKFRTNRIDTISYVEKVAEKFLDNSSNPLSLTISDYGTGKSHLAVTLGVLFSGPNFAPNTHRKVIENIGKCSAEKAAKIKELYSSNNFVIMLNGIRDFNLNSEVLKATQKSLDLYNIDNSFLSKLSKAQETAKKFLVNTGINNINLYEEVAESKNWRIKGNDLIKKLDSEFLSNDDAFDIVNSVYLKITGSEIEWTSGITAGDVLDLLVKELCGSDKPFEHIVILFDEFGRFLEYVSNTNNSTKTGDVALQQIFESAQNSNNKLQIINFIQSDIKTYLQRVDQTSNINRYIGRYDNSDKYYISSNLETVFANLIHRKNRRAFDDIIVKDQGENIDKWKFIHSNILRWVTTDKSWSNFSTFRDCIIEGIYPLHPLSTFMLTHLSDYLQSRSSLAIINSCIESINDIDLNDKIPLIMPEQLMEGDLFSEMLSAEESGRQKSKYCIEYNRVVGKIGNKLTNDALKVLRSILIINILKFSTRSKEDVKVAISICSGLTEEQIDKALELLENEYAVIGFDNLVNKYDFMIQANGNHDYKILKFRKMADFEVSKSILNDVQIQSLFDINSFQETDFSDEHKINTEEWKFVQKLLIAEEVSDSTAKTYINQFENATSFMDPKGTLLWVYINKDTTENTIDSLKKISLMFEKMPIIILLLNDNDNGLIDAIKEYQCLLSFDDSTINTFEQLYRNDLENIKQCIQEKFRKLQKNRKEVVNGEIIPVACRLHKQLSTVFDNIYTNTVPFNFDGISRGHGYQNYIDILNLLISDSINFDSIHNLQLEARNRIESLFSVESHMSWQCLTEEDKIIPPRNEDVNAIYENIRKDYFENKSIPLATVYNLYSKPPYGLCDEVITLIIALFIAKNGYGLKIRASDASYTINDWKDFINPEKKTINENDKRNLMSKFKKACLVHIDVGAVAERFLTLFDKIKNTKNISLYSQLNEEFENLKKQEEIPDELKDESTYIEEQLRKGCSSFKEWNSKIKAKENLIRQEQINPKLDNILNLQISISEMKLDPIYEKYNDVSDLQKDLDKLLSLNKTIIEKTFNEWMASVKCNTEEDIIRLNGFGYNLSTKLQETSFNELADKLNSFITNISAKRNEIKQKSELKQDIENFIKYSNKDVTQPLSRLQFLVNQSQDLLNRESEISLDKDQDVVNLLNTLKNINQIAQNTIHSIKKELVSIKEDIKNVSNIESIKSLQNRIKNICKRDIDEEENPELRDFLDTADEFVIDYDKLSKLEYSLVEFNKYKGDVLKKYENPSFNINQIQVLKDKIGKIETNFKFLDAKWKSSHLNLTDTSAASIVHWQKTILELPDYLSETTLNILEKEKERLGAILSKQHVATVIEYFNDLTNEEKQEFYNEISKYFNN